MKLEFKHLAAYLPYPVKYEMLDYKIDYVGRRYDELIGLHQWDKLGLHWSVLTVGGSKPNIDRIKPILRPLSDLTKEIEVNGEKFVPLVRLTGFNTEKRHSRLMYEVENNFSTYHKMERLFEWHFDVFGLIEKGLAIDINTLKL